jgi:hypothetical protein
MRQGLVASLTLVLLAACSAASDDTESPAGAGPGGGGAAGQSETAGGSGHRQVVLGPETGAAGGGAKGGAAGSGAAGSGNAGSGQSGNGQAGSAQAGAAGSGTEDVEDPGFSATTDPSEEDDLADDGLGHDGDEADAGQPSADPTEPSDYDYDHCNYDSDSCDPVAAGMGSDPKNPYADQSNWDTAAVAETSDGLDGADVAADDEVDDPPTLDDEPSSDDPDTGSPIPPSPPPDLPPGVKPFWHLAKPKATELEKEPGSLHKGKRWWLVSNTATPTFLLGVNSVFTPDSANAPCAEIDNYIFRTTSPQSPDPAKMAANAKTEWSRLKDWGFNSVAAWSHITTVPHSLVLNVTPSNAGYALKNATGTVLQGGTKGTIMVGDPYHPGFIKQLTDMAEKSVKPNANDHHLQMYFAGNELGIFDLAMRKVKGVRDFRRWLWSDCPAGSTLDAPQCTPHALGLHLRNKYRKEPGSATPRTPAATLQALNTAWHTSYTSFEQIVNEPAMRPVPFTPSCPTAGNCGEDLQEFVHDDLLKTWVVKVVGVIRAADPNHLISSPRLAVATPNAYRFWRPSDQTRADVWADDAKMTHPRQIPFGGQKLKYNPWPLLKPFDLISLNIYGGSTHFQSSWLNAGLRRIRQYTGRPINISEFSIRAKLPGWSNRGGANSFVPEVDISTDQKARASHYKSQVRQFLTYPYVVGASWHAWSDRYHQEDPKKQINMGLVQCTAPRLKDKVHPKFTGVATTASHPWDDMTGSMAPFNKGLMGGLIKRAQKLGGIRARPSWVSGNQGAAIVGIIAG